MALLQIPLRNDLPNYFFKVDLDGVTYGLEFQWNERCSVWTFDLQDDSGNVLVGSVQCVVNWPLLAKYTDIAVPRGNLFFYDTSGQGREIQALNELGQRVCLFYQEAGT